MTLKTLKDLEIGGEYAEINDIDVVSKEDLKQEAIQWYKLFEKKFIELCEGGIEGQLNVASYQGKMEFIKDFFNITDEDLK